MIYRVIGTSLASLFNMPQAARYSLEAISCVKERWRRASSEGGWRVAEDWFAPPIDHLIVACLSAAASAQWLEAAEALGLARGQAGVGIDETITDIACLAAAASPPATAPDPWQIARAVVRGWSRGAAGALISDSVRDPASGLGTIGYFTARLEEAYRAARAAGQIPGETYFFLFADTEVADAGPIHRLIRAAGLGEVMRQMFPTGEPLGCANAPAAVGIALVSQKRDPNALMARIRVRLNRQFAELSSDHVVRLPAFLWVEDLPPTFDQALDRLSLIVKWRTAIE